MKPGIQVSSGGGINTSSQNGSAAREGVEASSDSLDKLQTGLERTKAHAEILRKNWEAKENAADKIVSCRGCQKTFKSESGIKRHWTAKGNECTKEVGFLKESTLKPTAGDRMAGGEQVVDRLQKAQEAARQVAARLNGTKVDSREDGFTPKRLMTYPIGNFDRALRTSDTDVLEAFVGMRFDSATSSKKVMAIQELKRREKRLVS
jgi:hypothetical protein